jgi:hypothetical protein
MGLNDKYIELRNNPPKLKVVKNPREVILTIISCMCDNKNTLKFTKNDRGDFRLSGCGFALSNFGFKHPVHDIEWASDAGNWAEVFTMINSGTSVIKEIKSR